MSGPGRIGIDPQTRNLPDPNTPTPLHYPKPHPYTTLNPTSTTQGGGGVEVQCLLVQIGCGPDLYPICTRKYQPNSLVHCQRGNFAEDVKTPLKHCCRCHSDYNVSETHYSVFTSSAKFSRWQCSGQKGVRITRNAPA
ncbi:hypothetical protein T484DRAFT_1644179 [Baffinella frigidus]|nr:hypothetical protein T484DRAFT_1644179 [Cryptophyta sp. CCMP2293]